MKTGRGFEFGIFLLTIGVVWGLMSLGIISWSIIKSFFVLWPLILVVIGVAIIFRKNNIIKALSWVVFVAVLVTYSYFTDNVKYKGSEHMAGKNVIIERQAQTQKGNLKLAFGATEIFLDSKSTANMLEAEIQDPDITYTQNSNNDSASISFEKRSYQIKFNNAKLNNYRNYFHLNNQAVWDMDIDTGAVNAEFNMSDLTVEKLNLDTGASNIKLTFGEKAPNPNVRINAGASNISVYVPKNAGVKVKMDGGLNSTNFNGPQWEKRDGYYYSKNYHEAEVKIDLDVDMGVGTLKVKFS